MPKIITTGATIALTDTDIASITFAYEDGELSMIVKYRVLDDSGKTYQVHSVGAWPGHAKLKAEAEKALRTLRDEIMEREGL